MILAIDPGTEQSAFVVYDAGRIVDMGIWPNSDLLEHIGDLSVNAKSGVEDMVIEMVAAMGMAVGKEVFETVFWIGRFVECWNSAREKTATRLYRRDVKLHLCGNMRAKDPNIRAALLDRFGPGKPKAVGTIKAPGPLYGIKSDIWSALAIAVTFADAGNLSPTGKASQG